jgi:hypothetical protein
LFGRGCDLSDQPHERHEFNQPHLQLPVTDHPGRTGISINALDIGRQPRQVALSIQRPAHLDSAHLVAPLGPHSVHATSRQLGLPCSGRVQLGKQAFSCVAGQRVAALDFGRSVWPLKNHWTRTAFAAPGGITGNFRAGWTDCSGLSENTLWFGGELQHLATVISITLAAHSPLAPWQLRSPDDPVNLIFTAQQRHQTYRRHGPFFANTQQWFGHDEGVLRGPQGERVPVHNGLG